MQSGWRSRALF